MRSENRLAELFLALDREPDELHGDFTPAVLALIELGWVAAPGLLERMLAESADTRLHAQRAFEGILMRDFGFVSGRGFANHDDENRFRQLWAAQGDYAYDASKSDRHKAVDAWRTWLKERGDE